ncbi:mechanosensitive ion channel family protein [Xanthobacter variabilis]|uniref:mechanosensitive ion channel family protein n=1 Tax=Xanthobacter variabilis TaxID=3119932 RepID=UPI00374F27E1
MPGGYVFADFAATFVGLYHSIVNILAELLTGVKAFPFDRVIAAAIVFFILFFSRKPVRHFIFIIAGRLFGGKSHAFRDDLQHALQGPVELLSIVLGSFLAFEVIKFNEDSYEKLFSQHIVETLFIIAVYWAIIAVITPLTEQLRPRSSKLTDSVIDWIRKALKSFVAFFAIAAILQQWGIRIGPLLAGMGIAGAAVALGAQALFKNLISGVLILLERRFQYGDWVKVEGVIEGTVESIGFRSTRIRQFDDSAVQVPNSDLADNAVINYSQMRRRRIYWLIGVPYSTTIDQLKTIRDGIESYIHTCPDFVPYRTASTFVRIDSFGSSSINIMVYCFTKTTNWGEWLLVKERLAYKIMEIVLGAGSGFAFPSTSLYVESLPEGRPEVFQPPEGARPEIAADGNPGAITPQGAPAMPEGPRSS